MTKMKKFILGAAMLGCLAMAGGFAAQEMQTESADAATAEYTVVDSAFTVHITNDYIPNGNFSIYLTLPQASESYKTSISVNDLASVLDEFGFYDSVMIGDKTLREYGFEGAWSNTLTYGEGEPKNIVRIPCHTEQKTAWEALNNDGTIVFKNGILQNKITLKEDFMWPSYSYFTGAEDAIVYRADCDYETERVANIAFDRHTYGKTDVEDLKVTQVWDGASAYIGVSLQGDDYLSDGTKLFESENHKHFYTQDYEETVLINGEKSLVKYYGIFNLNENAAGYYSFEIKIPETELQSITIPAGTRFPSRAMQEAKSLNNGSTIFIMYETKTDMTFVNTGDGFVLLADYMDVVKAELIEARAEQDDVWFYGNDVAKKSSAMAKAENALLTATTVEEINAIKEECLAVFASILARPVIVDTAKAQLKGYKAESDYFRGEEAALRAQYIEEAIVAIDNARSSNDVEDAVALAMSKIDALKTAAEYADEELAPVKEDARQAVEAYRASETYFAEESALIAAAREEALSAIAAAKTEEEIHSATSTFTETMDAFKTKGGYISDAIVELNAYTVGVVDVELIVSGAISSMELVESKADLDALMSAAKAAVDEKRSASVQAAKDQINAKKATILFDEYSASNQAVINALYKAAQDAIKNAKTQADLDSAVANFISGIDALEKLAPVKEDSGKKGGCGSIVGLTAVGVLACAGLALVGKKKED